MIVDVACRVECGGDDGGRIDGGSSDDGSNDGI